MLRLSDRGIPPHMLHLYESSAKKSSNRQFKDDAVRLPMAFRKIGAHIFTRFDALRPKKKSETFVPNSAKRIASSLQETQYPGAVRTRDTRWRTSKK